MGNFTHANQKFLKKHTKVFNTIIRYCAEPEPTKMTMKEINEHFGKAIEIVE